MRFFLLLFAFFLASSQPLLADHKNVFSFSLMAGETYGLLGGRASFGSFDLTLTPGFFSGGSRIWKGGTYAGFGLGVHTSNGTPGFYGMLGQEWRPVRVLGFFVEGNGHVTSSGHSSAFFTLGVSVGW